MPRKVLIKVLRGPEVQLPTLNEGELGFCTDTKKLYIGTSAGNQLLVAAQTVGDMLKSIYDVNDNGKVDYAEVADSVSWSGVTEKPSTYPPSAHTHDVLNVKPDNWKDANALPSSYDRGITLFFSNNPANKFNGVTYCTVLTIKGYSNMAATQYIYPYNVDAPISYRYGLYNTDAWQQWRSLAIVSDVMPKGPITWSQLKGV